MGKKQNGSKTKANQKQNESKNEAKVKQNISKSEANVNVNDNVNVNVNVNDNKIIKKYEQEIGLLTPNNLVVLNSYSKEFSEEMILKAIDIASMQNNKSMAYIKGILENWKRRNIKNLLDVERDSKRKTKLQQQNFNDEQIGDLEELFDN
jgi:DnaD/phage-associated family protein